MEINDEQIMRKMLYLFVVFICFSCSELIEKPDHLIDKDKMEDILIDLAMNEQSNIANPESNMELGTRFVLQKHQVEPKNFMESYQYYTLNKDLSGILDNAQKKMLTKYPELKEKLDEKGKPLFKDDMKLTEQLKNITPIEAKNKKQTKSKKDTVKTQDLKPIKTKPKGVFPKLPPRKVQPTKDKINEKFKSRIK